MSDLSMQTTKMNVNWNVKVTQILSLQNLLMYVFYPLSNAYNFKSHLTYNFIAETTSTKGKTVTPKTESTVTKTKTVTPKVLEVAIDETATRLSSLAAQETTTTKQSLQAKSKETTSAQTSQNDGHGSYTCFLL